MFRKEIKTWLHLHEIVLTFAVIGVLFLIVVIALDPLSYIKERRDNIRLENLAIISSALKEYKEENNNNYPEGINSIFSSTIILSSNATMQNLCSSLVPKYLSSFPVDPKEGYYKSCADFNSDYNLIFSGGKISLSAPYSESGKKVSVDEL